MRCVTTVLLIWQIFFIFTRVAMFSCGGGPASLALMQRKMTSARWLPPGQTEPVPWVTADEFADAVAIGNALPGPIAPQVSAHVSYKMAGVPGAIAAATGTVLPTTILMLLMIIYFFSIKDSSKVQSMLKAVRPEVVGLLLWTAFDMASTVFMAKKSGWETALTQGWDKLAIAGAAFLLLTFTTINPVLIILSAAILGLVVYH